jgi:hypothetical protein
MEKMEITFLLFSRALLSHSVLGFRASIVSTSEILTSGLRETFNV